MKAARLPVFGFLYLILLLQQATAQQAIKPPVATARPEILDEHGHTRIDDYYWLRDRENPEVISYLEAENAYLDAVMAHTKGLKEQLFEEMKGRIKEDDATVPYKKGDYLYYQRYEPGKEYPIHARKKGSLDRPEEILLDVNELAEGHDYYAVSGFEVSPDGNTLAYASDSTGRRQYTIFFKDLKTGRTYEDKISNATNNIAWANDNKTLFYTKQDPETLRWYQIYRHSLGSHDPDVLVYEEHDEEFNLYVSRTKSGAYLLITSVQTLSSEARYLDANTPSGEWKVFLPRERGHEYSIDHHGDHFVVRTNDEARNFRIVRTPVSATDRQNWEEIIPHSEDVLVEGAEVFRDYLVVSEREDGLTRMRVRPWSGAGEHFINFVEPAYTIYPAENHEMDSETFRFTYTSLTTPQSVYDYDLSSRERTLLKRSEVLGGFDQGNYVTERLMAPARDGVLVPISLVYRKGFERNGTHPLLLYGYGSYGYSIDPTFSSVDLSLLDRGFVYAIAHIRGGQEMGRYWYEDGKLLEKKNTFTDFIDAAEYLADQNYGDPQRLFAYGGSAGGLLMGAVMNMRPSLFKGIVAAVPFVDITTTMLDESIPLTTSEYDEWGNPNDSTYYRYILSYSPYDNVERKNYPHLLVTAGLHDSQVQYWEAAKWVAKLRAMKTDNNRLLLYTNMDAGHGGASGRFEALREYALIYAFMLDLAGTTHVETNAN